MKTFQKIISVAALLLPLHAMAGEVEILDASFSQQSDKAWSVSVTLQHADTGWENYADAWRVVAGKDTVLATRTLIHPHVDEQPFTRSLSPVKIPAGLTTVYIEAHDLVHGWSSQRLEINLLEAREGRLKVNR